MSGARESDCKVRMFKYHEKETEKMVATAAEEIRMYMPDGKVINASSGWLPANTYRRWRTTSFRGPRAFVDHQTPVDDKQTLRREREREWPISSIKSHR